MSTFLTISGPSGGGKTRTLIKLQKELSGKVNIFTVPKFTSRSQRGREEFIDNEFGEAIYADCDELWIKENCDIVWKPYGDAIYGISSKQIDEIFELENKGINGILICNDFDVIEKLKEKYRAFSIYVDNEWSVEKIRDNMQNQGKPMGNFLKKLSAIYTDKEINDMYETRPTEEIETRIAKVNEFRMRAMEYQKANNAFLEYPPYFHLIGEKMWTQDDFDRFRDRLNTPKKKITAF